ncbi:MAG: hypothetical protein RLY31_390 [Bacteroidota bacterium]|jgi:hypothetical protein
MKKSLLLPLLAVTLSFLLPGCVKDDFDQPPTTGEDPGLTANYTIAELKALHQNGGPATTVSEDLVISGIVIADDFSGNWYRTFVIQDETGGIEILTDLRDSYVLYPRGREIYVKCKGLVIKDYNNLVQLGGYVAADNSLGPIVEVADFLVKGAKQEVPAPRLRKINELTTADVSTLVTLENVQFSLSDAGRTFADAVNQAAANVFLQDCALDEVIVRTSGFADFAGATVPAGNGSFTGVLSIFRNDLQFLIRDLDDLSLDGTRCQGGANPCDGTGSAVTVNGIDENFESGANNDPVQLYGWTNIATKGSRSWQFKEFSGNVYAQATAYNDNAAEMETWLVSPFIQLTEPLSLSFETTTAYYTHDGLSVLLSFDYECDPLAATWQPLNAALAGQNDANYAWVPSGNIDLSSLVGQTFAIAFKYVGSGTNGQTCTFQLDNIKLGSGGGPVDPCVSNPTPVVPSLDENFNTGANNAEVNISGWNNFIADGARSWLFKEFSGDVYVQATAYNDTGNSMDTWLISPLIEVDGPKELNFQTAKAFWTHDGLTVYLSTDYDCRPLDATWTPLQNITVAGQNDADHAWIASGPVDLSPYIGKKVAIGFRYVGSGTGGQTTSYRVDNVVVD